ncbi:DUF7146 domain-containing protein [Phenylobacterium deserti]|uniref:Virulence-associated protein E n=1 Tax=Phenylobacterium deserti TaxID=1914756 RepID=A0A328AD69_9CAUL|nr:toprim domain-containing protein [Phenylobacterium deserti]RAK52619.1 virulence-associated protein E [Phenylobacterium deserti]
MSVASLEPIVRALGGDLWAGGLRANVPAPGHGARDRSVSLLLEGGRVVIHSFGRADWRDVLRDLQARGLVDADGRLAGVSPTGAATMLPPAMLSPAGRRRTAEQLWSEGGALQGLASRHLAHRSVRTRSAALRFHPAVPAAVYAGRGRRRPALLARVQAPDGSTCAVEITYLAADGSRAALPLARKTVGVLPTGAAVRLDPPGPTLLVAEGVFSALSAGQHFGLPAWALLSAPRLPGWRPPPGVQAVLVAADRGAAGEQAAAGLVRALRADGWRARVRLPPAPFGDWNEAAAAGAGEVERGRGGASRTDGWSGPPARRP